jgi:pyruvate,orthophosphate dikinase
MPKHIYFLYKKNISPEQVNVSKVGNKGYSLIRMANIDLPIPPALILETGFCDDYFVNNENIDDNFKDLLMSNIRLIENTAGLIFGGTKKPLLVSVRSGGPVSMPGMLETLCNIGLSEKTIPGMIRMTGNPKMVWDLYRRLIANFAEVIYECKRSAFEEISREFLKKYNIDSEYQLSTNTLKTICGEYLNVFKEYTGESFPEDPYEQLMKAAIAVFRSWNSSKAQRYRKIHNIPNTPGTAVIIQQMVFGNSGGTSGAGVAFTRNPSNGNKELYMDFILNAQGEDIVSGRTLLKSTSKLEDVLPDVYKEVIDVASKLECEFKDMQEFEFTVENRKLFLLQTRTGKRTDYAAIIIACVLVKDSIISREEALRRIEGIGINNIKEYKILNENELELIGQAIPASFGVVSGKIAFSEESVKKFKKQNANVIFITYDIVTDNIGAMHLSDGILTTVGSKTSHAAVVARQLNKVCLIGCSQLVIDINNRECYFSGKKFTEGAIISLNGISGNIYKGEIKFSISKPIELINEIEKIKSLC